jgi:hypothetical protein
LNLGDKFRGETYQEAEQQIADVIIALKGSGKDVVEWQNQR